MRRRRRGRSRGQAMVELAVILPVMMVLFLGSWTAADLIGDNDTAVQATRSGARYAAELGSGGYITGGSSNPTAVDHQIIEQMLPIVTGHLPNAVVTEIDIYQPDGTGCTVLTATCPPDNGAYAAPELIDAYPISGTTIGSPTTQSYTLDQRKQTHPFESELGVRICFTYTSPTLTMFTQSDTQYTVVRLAPVE